MIFGTYVPRSGQAKTVQGELIRAVEKLRDEAHRNGNVNWDDGYGDPGLLPAGYPGHLRPLRAPIVEQIDRDIARLLHFDVPETDDEPYDRLIDRVLEWGPSAP